jgi:hypothetical protein
MKTRRYVAAGAAASVLALAGPMPVSNAAATGSVHIIQAVPKAAVSVTIDGRKVKSDAQVGAVLGPFSLAAGKHTVRFVDGSGDVSMSSAVTVKAGSSTDVVLHRPASVSGEPVVNVYQTPRKAIGPGKARVLLAHTATVAPADVRVDGKVVFTNIANGEYAEADVPAGVHEVALLPTGQTKNPILGPLDVDLPARTVTMVYAVGSPKNGSMSAISHSAAIAADGTVEPGTITTGSAGLAAQMRVTTFAQPRAAAQQDGSAATWWWAPLGACVVLASRRLWIRRTPRYADAPSTSARG